MELKHTYVYHGYYYESINTKLTIYNNKTTTYTNTKKKMVKLHTSSSSLSSSLSSGIP